MATNQEYSLAKYLDENSTLGFGKYKVSSAKCINVLLIGRSQVGKSTIVETLLCPQKGTQSVGFSITKDPSMQTLILTDERTMHSYQVNIIDTPGLGEIRDDNKNRNDDSLLTLVAKCVERKITWINVVCFVTKAKETQRHDAKIFQKLTQFLGPDYADISMMVVTHCDDYSDTEREVIIENIRSHPTTKPYLDYCKLGTYCFGALNCNKVEGFKERLRKAVVEDKLEEIEKMRDDILTKIIECGHKEKQIYQLKSISDEAYIKQQQVIKEAIRNHDAENADKGGCVVQ